MCFFFNDTATTEIYTLSLHDALPIFISHGSIDRVEDDRTDLGETVERATFFLIRDVVYRPRRSLEVAERSEEHTSELQSRQYLVCRLLLEKKTYTTFSLVRGMNFTLR